MSNLGRSLAVAALVGAFAGFSYSGNAADAERDLASRAGVKETVQGAELQFEVIVNPEEKEVVVVPVPDSKVAPPQLMRVNLIRKDARSVPVELRTISIPNTGNRYAGKLDIWNDSYIGIEIRFSFDSKNWKRVRHEFRNGKP